MTWYRFLYWRLATWHERWKGPGQLSGVWGLVWLWILHVLNATTCLFLVLRSSLRARGLLTPVFVQQKAWVVGGGVALAGLWGWSLLRRRAAIRDEFRSLEGRPFPTRGDLAVLAYMALSLLSFGVVYIFVLAETVARR